MTTPVTLSDAHRRLLTLASNGREYRNNQVYHAYQLTTGTELDIIASGFDLERRITVTLDGIATEAHVQLRVLAMRNGNLFIRTWLNWTSPFGDHRSYVGYDLSPEAIVKIGALPVTPDTSETMDITDLDYEDTLDLSDALSAIGDYMGEMDDLGVTWQQHYPSLEELSNEEVEYHGKFVLAARDVEPKLLNMLSDSELGSPEAQEIIDLLDWLSQQPEVTALA